MNTHLDRLAADTWAAIEEWQGEEEPAELVRLLNLAPDLIELARHDLTLDDLVNHDDYEGKPGVGDAIMRTSERLDRAREKLRNTLKREYGGGE